MSYVSLFSNASLSIEARQQVCFFDEELPLSLRIELPKDVAWTEDQARLLFKSAVTLVFEIGYAEEAGAPSRKRFNAQVQAGLGVSAVALPVEPLTPVPLPSIEAGLEAYADVVPVSSSTVTWDADRDGMRTESRKGRLTCYLDVKALLSYPSTPLASPMLLVTATVAFREIAEPALLKALKVSGYSDTATQATKGVTRQRNDDDEYAFVPMLEVNLLSGLSGDPHFSKDAPYLPSYRLSRQAQRSTFGGGEAIGTRGRSSSISHVRSSSGERIDPEAVPSIRRSVRAVLRAMPALFIRLRAVARGPLLCVELENNPEHECCVEVLGVDILAEPMQELTMPLLLKPIEQMNLVYTPTATTQNEVDGPNTNMSTPIAATMSPSRSFSRRPLPALQDQASPAFSIRTTAEQKRVSIAVRARVLQKDDGTGTDIQPLTAVFTSRCSIAVNLAELAASADRPVTDGKISKISRETRMASSATPRQPQASSELVAGSRRHTANNLAAMNEAARRALTAVPLVAPTPRTLSSQADSPRRIASALPLPAFGRRFFSTPTPASPAPAQPSEDNAASVTPGESLLSPPSATPAYPPYSGPSASATSYFDRQGVASTNDPQTGLIVSIALQTTHKPERSNEYVETWQKEQPVIHVLDTFFIEVFMSNRSTTIRRFTIGVPARKARKRPHSKLKNTREETFSRADRLERYAAIEASKAGLMPLENHVRIGPLLPNTVQAVKMRFLALQPGIHAIDELQLVEVGTGNETRLRDVLTIAVDDIKPKTSQDAVAILHNDTVATRHRTALP